MIRAVDSVSLFRIQFEVQRLCVRISRPAAKTLRFLLLTILVLFALPLLTLPLTAAQSPSTFKGEITDEHLNCIQTPMKAAPGINNKLSCVLYWAHFVQPPSKYVLYDAATNKTYQLSDQNLVQPYVAEKVMVTGKLDPATKTIQVTSIKADEESARKS